MRFYAISAFNLSSRDNGSASHPYLILKCNNKVYNERKDQFSVFLFDLGKLIRFDKETKEIYEIIEPIIDSYCNQFIDKCELDEITYDRIFNELKGIRTNKKNIEHLANLLIRKE